MLSELGMLAGHASWFCTELAWSLSPLLALAHVDFLSVLINPFPVLIKTRKYRINNNFLSKFVCHEPYIEITCNYFLQVAQTPEVS